jgi:hypothetical protein
MARENHCGDLTAITPYLKIRDDTGRRNSLAGVGLLTLPARTVGRSGKRLGGHTQF